MSEYKTSPADLEGMPPGVPHIIGNEAAERFSFYGMKAVLAVFMAQYLHLMNDVPGEAMSEASATANVHLFNGWVYLTPFLGAILSDVFWGKYKTIIWLSLVYVMGHAALAFMGVTGEARWWLFAGLALICLGSGGIKPCVSAHVGDQFGARNAHLLPKVFNWFYFSINLGAMASMMLTPWLLKWYGPHWAFGVPGVLMALATVVFWVGRKRFIHVPAGGRSTLAEMTSPEGVSTILRLLPLYLFVAMFWALFDQTGSTWIFQAQDMDREFLGFEWLPSQVQSLNSLFVLTFIPLFAYVLYPKLSKVWPLTPLRKISVGLFVMAAAFGIVALVQTRIDGGASPNIGWQVLAYAMLTASEVMVSIVALEFAYTQSPKTMKSMVMCFYLGAVALGNFFTAGINHFIEIDEPEKVVESVGTKAALEEAVARVSAEGRGVKVDDLQDEWGNPLQAKVLNSRTLRISSAGEDNKPRTQWDRGVRLVWPEEVKEEKESWTSALQPDTPWLEARMDELGLNTDEEQVEASDYPFEVEWFVGGGTKLEGAAYFWFFAGLMLLTAIGFIPYAMKYRGKTVLQD
ncbi:MAG: POT family MFS transporter [Verrucomicrobiota bacterium JB023]|nr:POT family MFS transporter [Verrucomicrobiota bacterium JB023]